MTAARPNIKKTSIVSGIIAVGITNKTAVDVIATTLMPAMRLE